MSDNTDVQWVKDLQGRGFGDALLTALDLLEPFGPLGAQLLWIAQPAFSVFGGQTFTRVLAQALEELGGVERLRKALEEAP